MKIVTAVNINIITETHVLTHVLTENGLIPPPKLVTIVTIPV